MSQYKSFVILSILLIGWLLCPPARAAGPNEKIKVFVSIVPQKYFVEKIGGDLVDVVSMVQPGNSPHDYEPKGQQMIELTRAKIYFAIGVPFETVWLSKLAAANPKMAIVHTEADVVKMPVTANALDTAKPQENALDPHIWLSPRLVMIQAHSILEALLTIAPQHVALLMDHYKKFVAELVDLDLELMELFKQSQAKQFMVFHPAWSYFAKDYGLTQIAIEVDGKEPKTTPFLKTLELAKKMKIEVVFAQPEFSTKSSRTIAEAVLGEVIFVSPLSEDWKNNLKSVALQFKAALR
jgi:zinc transport system substrate-binding protein